MEQSTAGSTGGKSKEEVVLDLAIDFSSRLPEAFDIQLARYKYPVMYYESMNSVLHQEMIRFNRLSDVKSLQSSTTFFYSPSICLF
jgi:dynein heavy chain